MCFCVIRFTVHHLKTCLCYMIGDYYDCRRKKLHPSDNLKAEDHSYNLLSLSLSLSLSLFRLFSFATWPKGALLADVKTGCLLCFPRKRSDILPRQKLHPEDLKEMVCFRLALHCLCYQHCLVQTVPCSFDVLKPAFISPDQSSSSSPIFLWAVCETVWMC